MYFKITWKGNESHSAFWAQINAFNFQFGSMIPTGCFAPVCFWLFCLAVLIGFACLWVFCVMIFHQNVYYGVFYLWLDLWYGLDDLQLTFLDPVIHKIWISAIHIVGDTFYRFELWEFAINLCKIPQKLIMSSLSQYLSTWECVDIVRRYSFLISCESEKGWKMFMKGFPRQVLFT